MLIEADFEVWLKLTLKWLWSKIEVIQKSAGSILSVHGTVQDICKTGIRGDFMYLEELVDDIQLESDKFECKSILNRNDVIGWLKSIAGLDRKSVV